MKRRSFEKLKDALWLAAAWLGVAAIAVLALASLIYVARSCHLCT